MQYLSAAAAAATGASRQQYEAMLSHVTTPLRPIHASLLCMFKVTGSRLWGAGAFGLPFGLFERASCAGRVIHISLDGVTTCGISAEALCAHSGLFAALLESHARVSSQLTSVCASSV